MGTPSSEDIGRLKKKKIVLVTRLSGKSDKFVFSRQAYSNRCIEKRKGWEKLGNKYFGKGDDKR